MPPAPRPYRTGDTERMIALAHADVPASIHVLDLPYSLASWALDEPRNAALWEDEHGHLVAWAVLQTPFWAIDYAYLPSAAHLHPTIVEWAWSRAREAADGPWGRPCWFINVRADQTPRLHTIEAAGFARLDTVAENAWSKVWMRRPGATPVASAPLPAGFSLRPLAGAAEVEAYVALHREVFQSMSMTADWRHRTLLRSEYAPELDLVVEAPDGRLAAFCIAWFSRHGFDGQPAGQIEPLGVHPDFRRQGLGRAVLLAAVRRLHERGAETIYVETDKERDAAMQLYHAGGFAVLHTILVCRKDLPSTTGE